MIRILVTGVGSLLGQGILKSIQNSKLDCHIIGTDYFSSAVGLYWVNKGYLLPDILRSEISETQWVESLIDIINKEKREESNVYLFQKAEIWFALGNYAEVRDTCRKIQNSPGPLSDKEQITIDYWLGE